MSHSEAAEVIFMASIALNRPPAVGLEGGHTSRRNMTVPLINVLYVRETPAPAGQPCMHIDTTKGSCMMQQLAALDFLSFMPSFTV
jgi:hypothetical protein